MDACVEQEHACGGRGSIYVILALQTLDQVSV